LLTFEKEEKKEAKYEINATYIFQ